MGKKESTKRVGVDKNNFTVLSALKYFSIFYDKMHFNFFLFYFGRLITMLESVIVPILIGLMINLVVYYQDFERFLQVGMILLCVCVFCCVLNYLIYEIYSDFWNKIVERIRKKTYSIVLHMTATGLSNSNYGDLSQQIQWKVTECVQLVVKNVIHNVNNILQIFVCIFLIFRISVLLGVVTVVLLPISGYISWTGGKVIRKEKNRNQQEYGRYINWMYEVFGHYKELRLLSAESRVESKLIEHQQELIKTDVKASIATILAQNIINNVNVWVQMILYVILAWLSVKEGLTIGTVTVVLGYYTTLNKSILVVVGDYFSIQGRMSILQRVSEILEAETETDTGTISGELQNATVSFKDVTFAYRGKEDVLRDFNLDISAGEKLAIVGESGCGKSTLAYMLIGFYRPNSGTVLLNGRALEEYSLSYLRRNIGVVQQEIFIFDGSIRDNIMIGNPDATEEMMINAVKAAGAYEFIMEMEDKFDTMLGKNGRQLSGGQKQRISIARVYLKNPSLIIFDEATASLDQATEEKILGDWEQILAERTAIVIAHRKSSVMMCQKIALMEEGRIVEIGTPEYMAKNSAKFRTLFAIGEGE